MAGKADIINHIAESVDGISKKQAGEALDAAIAAITEHLGNGERVQLPGFGSFSIGERAARTGRNPRTGEAIQIKASKNVKFKSGAALKGAVN